MDKQSDIVKQVEAYNAGIQIDNGAAQDIYNFVTRHSREELKELGVNAYQLFKDKYTREHNTTKYYNLLNGEINVKRAFDLFCSIYGLIVAGPFYLL